MIARRALYLLSCAVLVASYGLIVQPSEQSVREVQAHARDLYDEANANEIKIRRSVELAIAARRVRNDISKLNGSPAATTASALELLNSQAKHLNVAVRSVSPDAATPIATPDADGLQGFVWSVGLRGRFRDIVTMLADLSKHGVLIGVQDAALTAQGVPNEKAGSAPVVDANVTISIYRPANGLVTEVTNASSPAR